MRAVKSALHRGTTLCVTARENIARNDVAEHVYIRLRSPLYIRFAPLRNDWENRSVISSLAQVLCYITLRYVTSRNLTASKRVNRRVHTSSTMKLRAPVSSLGKHHLIHVYPRGQYRVCYMINAAQRC